MRFQKITLNLSPPSVHMSPWPQKFIMCITGMGRSVRSIAQLNAFIITQLRKDFPEEGSLEQPRANWSNLHACHGQKSCSHIFCIAHYDLWLRKVPAYYSPLSLLSTLTSEAHDQSVCISVRMATLDGSPCLPPHARFRPLLRLCLAMCSSAFSSWPMVFRAQSLLMATLGWEIR